MVSFVFVYFFISFRELNNRSLVCMGMSVCACVHVCVRERGGAMSSEIMSRLGIRVRGKCV